MQRDVIMAGFGGQGILLIGKMLAYAGMHEGMEVSWLPSYGPEMRGGTANCTVVISDRPVGSPVIRSPRAVVASNSIARSTSRWPTSRWVTARIVSRAVGSISSPYRFSLAENSSAVPSEGSTRKNSMLVSTESSAS